MTDLDHPNLWLRMARDPAAPPPPTSGTGLQKLVAAGRARWIAVLGLAAVGGLGAAYCWVPWGAGSAAPRVQTAASPPSSEEAEPAVQAPALARDTPLVAPAPAAPSVDEVGVEVEPTLASASAHDAVRLKEVLRWAVRNAQQCHKEGRSAGTAQLLITFAPSGKVSEAQLEGEPIASAPVARCILDYARAIFLPPFDGAPFTVSRTITLR